MIELEIEPVPASRPRFTRRGRFISTYYPKSHNDFKTTLNDLLEKEELTFITEPLRLEIIFTLTKPPSAKRKHPSVKPDLDNLAKLVMDCLNQKLFKDDALVCELVLKKQYGKGSIKISWALL